MTDASDVERVLPPEAYRMEAGIGEPDDRDLEIDRLRGRIETLETIARLLIDEMAEMRRKAGLGS